MRLLPLLALLCVGCSTTVYHNGRPGLRMYSNAVNVTYYDGSTYFHADSINNSTPTRAAGSVIGTSLSGGTALTTAILTRGAIR